MKVTLPIIVIAFETDFAGVVSNTRYLEYMERGRYALAQAAGVRITDIWDELGVQPILRCVKVDYLNTARHEDELLLAISVAAHTRSTTQLHFELTRCHDHATVMRAEQTLAYVNRSFRPVRVPEIYRTAFAPEPDGRADSQ